MSKPAVLGKAWAGSLFGKAELVEQEEQHSAVSEASTAEHCAVH